MTSDNSVPPPPPSENEPRESQAHSQANHSAPETQDTQSGQPLRPAHPNDVQPHVPTAHSLPLKNPNTSEATHTVQHTYVAQPVYVQQGNGIAVAGFILSICAWFASLLPIAGWIVWLLGLVFSFIGLFKKPRGFAIAGLVISLIGIIFIMVIGALLAGIIFSMSE